MRLFTPSSWNVLNSGTVRIESESIPGVFYFVGLKSLKCSCPSAISGHICKHGRWVANNRQLIATQKQGGLFSQPQDAGETGKEGELL